METVTISELKKRLSAYLKKVRAGQTILVLYRDQAIARLEPVVGADHGEDRLARLERSGLVRRATRPVPLRSLRAVAARPAAGVVEALIAERAKAR
jgi:antitoxin (DNA-binding transcriptional repressor) of toxin-antitoxin stability system